MVRSGQMGKHIDQHLVNIQPAPPISPPFTYFFLPDPSSRLLFRTCGLSSEHLMRSLGHCHNALQTSHGKFCTISQIPIKYPTFFALSYKTNDSLVSPFLLVTKLWFLKALSSPFIGLSASGLGAGSTVLLLSSVVP